MSMPMPDDRSTQLRRAIDEHPERVMQAREQLAWADTQSVTGHDSQAEVAVTVSGHGRVEAVRVSHSTLRTLDNATLADRVMAAVNDGLDRAAALLPAATGGPTDVAADDAAMRRFEQRMDVVLDGLDRIGRRLDRFEE